eukprot:COSAG05_NODE_885_length_6763_cov_10.115396_7_plen_123_part_00
MTEIYLHIRYAQYGLYSPNAPRLVSLVSLEWRRRQLPAHDADDRETQRSAHLRRAVVAVHADQGAYNRSFRDHARLIFTYNFDARTTDTHICVTVGQLNGVAVAVMAAAAAAAEGAERVVLR